MKRKALLIGNPGEPGAENYCGGVLKDLENYSTFLTSPLGGAWTKDEVKVLQRPTSFTTRVEIEALKTADYSFAAFCGHGHTDRATKQLVMELRSGQYLHEHELKVGATRHSTIFDCCRVVATSVLTEDRMMKALMAKAEQSARSSRLLFDDALSKCPAGLIALFACSVGETAGDDTRSGGYYSSSILLGARDWSDSASHSTVLSIIGGHTAAVPMVQKRSGNRQNPADEKPRLSPYFPFAVIA